MEVTSSFSTSPSSAVEETEVENLQTVHGTVTVVLAAGPQQLAQQRARPSNFEWRWRDAEEEKMQVSL